MRCKRIRYRLSADRGRTFDPRNLRCRHSGPARQVVFRLDEIGKDAMKNAVSFAKGLLISDLLGESIYSVRAFCVLVLRQCGIYPDSPASSTKLVGLLACFSKFTADFHLYTLFVSVGHGAPWLPSFLISLGCYRDRRLSQWPLIKHVPSFQTSMQLVPSR